MVQNLRQEQLQPLILRVIEELTRLILFKNFAIIHKDNTIMISIEGCVEFMNYFFNILIIICTNNNSIRVHKVIDGNTLSTFWGEGGFAGDDMYGKIDPDNIERIEVIRGPGSVLYGSNALGGVLNFITRESPFDYQECGTRWGGRVENLTSTSSKPKSR